MLLLLTLAAFGTAVLSATFGMAGGLVLMGVYTALLPVEAAMVLHGVTQLLANGLRAGVHRRHVAWRGVGAYAVGALLAAAVAAVVRVVPDRATVYLGLGLLPFVARFTPGAERLHFGTPAGAGLAGLLVVGVQSIAGVAGPLLDLFFLRGDLDRHAVVGTKAATQSLSHLLKIAVFGAMLAPGALAAPEVVGVLLGATAGTLVGSRLLDRWSEAGFRRASRWLVLAVGGVYLGMGLAAL